MRISWPGPAVLATALVLTATPAVAAEPTWRDVPLPFLWRDSAARAVAATGADAVWVLGYQGYKIYPPPINTVSHGSPVVRRWTGSAWREYPLNGWSGIGYAGRLAAGPSGTWISTGWWDQQRDYLARFNGTAFEPVAPPPGHEPEVMDAGPAGTWVKIGRPGTVHGEWALHRRTGDTWTEVPVPERYRASFAEVKARTATEVWAVGSHGQEWTNNYALTRWDGTTWHDVPIPDDPARKPGWGLEHVAPVSANEVWVTGNGEVGHWKNGTWTFTKSPGPNEHAGDITIAADGTPWLEAMTQDNSRSTLYRHVNGTWQEAALPAGVSVSAITAVPGSPALWAAGSNLNSAATITTG